MEQNRAMNAGYELDWDATIEHDSVFTLLPEGDYPFVVQKLERGRHSGSAKLPPCNKAILTIRFDGGEQGATVTQENLFLFSTCEGLLCAFFTAIGLRKPGEKMALDWSHVVGAAGWAHLGVRSWTGKDGAQRQSNYVVNWIDPEKAPKTEQKPAAQTWTPGQF